MITRGAMTVLDMLEFYQIKNDCDLFGLWQQMDVVFDERLDLNRLWNVLLERVGTCTPRWNVTRVFQAFSENFFAAQMPIISRRLDILLNEHDPLINYRKEIHEGIVDNQEQTAASTSRGTTLQDVSAYNADDYQPRDKTDASSHAESESNTDYTRRRNYAESGQTADSTKLLLEELEFAEHMNIYDWLAARYEESVCMAIY